MDELFRGSGSGQIDLTVKGRNSCRSVRRADLIDSFSKDVSGKVEILRISSESVDDN